MIIASESGPELYVFSSTGRHLRTLYALTGALIYKFTYDANGRLSQVEDGSANKTIIGHDADGNPTAITAPDGQTTLLAVSADGYLASATDPTGAKTEMSYTSGGLLSAFKNARGNTTTMEYDSLGRLVSEHNPAAGSWSLSRAQDGPSYFVNMTSALGRTDGYRVDEIASGDQRRRNTSPDGSIEERLIGKDGVQTTTAADGTVTRLTQSPDPRFGMQAPLTSELKITTPAGLVSTTTTTRTTPLADANNLLSLTASTDKVVVNGRTHTSAYDAALKQFTDTSAAGRQAVSRIDTLGRVVFSQVSGIAPLNTSYDARGRLTTLTHGSGADQRNTTMNYNAQGYLASVTDPLGQVASFQYDLAGRVTKQTLPDGIEVLFTYDANGNVKSITPPGRPAHTFAYTPVDLDQTYTPPAVPDAGTLSTAYTYNEDKQLTRVTRPDAQTIDLSYDTGGRLATQITPSGTVTYTYAAGSGQLASISALGGVELAYSYDGFLPLSESWSGTVAGTVARVYNNDFQPTQIVFNGEPVTLAYDSDRLLTGSGALTITRSPTNGLITGTTLGSLATSQAYNAFGELSTLGASYGAASLYSASFARDKLGRITYKTETVTGEAKTYAYEYDPAGRLSKVTIDGSSTTTYTYDANGNRLTANAEAATYDAQDRLTNYAGASFAYTANGEVKSMTAGAQTTLYNYDVLGNLRGVTLPGGTVIEYLIDGRNRRIGKKVGGTLLQGFLYQDQLKPVAELDGTGSVVARFVYGTRPNVPEYMVKGGVTYRFIHDHLGSPRLVVNTATGDVAQRIDYDPWGFVTLDTNPGFQPFGFAGGLYDRDTKLVRFGARDYDGLTGRWTAKDPLGFEGGSTSVYSYVLNSPPNAIDPSGLRFGLREISLILAALLGFDLDPPVSIEPPIEGAPRVGGPPSPGSPPKKCKPKRGFLKPGGYFNLLLPTVILTPELQAVFEGQISPTQLMLVPQGYSLDYLLANGGGA